MNILPEIANIKLTGTRDQQMGRTGYYTENNDYYILGPDGHPFCINNRPIVITDTKVIIVPYKKYNYLFMDINNNLLLSALDTDLSLMIPYSHSVHEDLTSGNTKHTLVFNNRKFYFSTLNVAIQFNDVTFKSLPKDVIKKIISNNLINHQNNLILK